MSTVRKTPTPPDTLADLVKQLGGVPLHRIRLHPPLGRATEKDLAAHYEAKEHLIFELVDGVFVEKFWGFDALCVNLHIFPTLHEFVSKHGLGVGTADVPVRLLPGLVRVPDACFFGRDKLRRGRLPDQLLLRRIPDLVIEVVDESNTPQEMRRKRGEYLQAGVQALWEIQEKTQTAAVYTSPTTVKHIPKGGTLDGGELLPGFKLSLTKLFNRGKRKQGKGKSK